ncbi:MAG: hypothetical protein HY738_02085 [Bacteroidia bacterium]|nr:hypothetical protein [Bacteroidia bacterium]
MENYDRLIIYRGQSYSLKYKSNKNSGINLWINYTHQRKKNDEVINTTFVKNIINGFIQFNFGGGNDYIGIKSNTGRKIFQYFGTSLFYHYRTGAKNFRQEDLDYYYRYYNLNMENFPAFSYFDLLLEKGFPIIKNRFYINSYIMIQNLFNRRNVFYVYQETGQPDDDGFLTDPRYQNIINQQYNEQSYRDLYQVYINNPAHYDIPRIVRVGLSLSF